MFFYLHNKQERETLMKMNGTRQSEQWSVILAGGEGTRMRPMVEQWLGYHKPKQFCAFTGKRSMLQHTWDRADQLTSPQHKVTVVGREHCQEVWAQLENRRAGRVVVQPRNCDTAAGIFLSLTYVRAQNPEATVVLYPSDHFVFPANRFMETVRRAVKSAEYLANRVILVGVIPTNLELEYGWIFPGQHLSWSTGSPVYQVKSFLEKPDRISAQTAMEAGALWNTLVLAAKVETLWKLGRRCFPDLIDLFENLGSSIGSSEEGQVLESIYRVMPSRNFSSDLLEQVPDQVGVVELRGVMWSDWGRPEQILETLQALGKVPVFPMVAPVSGFHISEAAGTLLQTHASG